MNRTTIRILASFTLITLTLAPAAERTAVAYTPVFGGPVFDVATGNGYHGAVQKFAPGIVVNNDGLAIGQVGRFAAGAGVGQRAVTWNPNSTGTELQNLGLQDNGTTFTVANALNNSGLAVGNADKYVAGTSVGNRAMRWNIPANTATELDNLGLSNAGFTNSYAYGVNSAGTTVGRADRYISGTNYGNRAVRWNAGGTAPTELDSLAPNANNVADSEALAINDAGTIVGSSTKYNGNAFLGDRAVRWAAGGTAITQLGTLLFALNGATEARAYAINAAGTAAGYSKKYSLGGGESGTRAVRWDADTIAASELGDIGLSLDGSTDAQAYAINTAGTAVGYATKFTSGAPHGSRAVRWNAGGSAATELGNLGLDANDSTGALAYDINDAGVAVGYASKFVNEVEIGDRAVAWRTAGVAIDLNNLVDPASGWTLNRAFGISDTYWISGVGQFDPDGSGPIESYDRLFLIHIPEPTTATLAFAAFAFLVSWHRLARRRCHC